MMPGAADQDSLRHLGRSHVERVLAFRCGLGLRRIRTELGGLRMPTQASTSSSNFYFVQPTVSVPVFQKLSSVEGEPLATDRLTGRTVVARAEDFIAFGYDLWSEVGAALLGRPSPQGVGEASWSALFAVPFIDAQIGLVLDWLEESRGIEPDVTPWPNGGTHALGLSHDIDRIRKTYQHVTKARAVLRRNAARNRLRALLPRGSAYWGFEAIREIESKRGMRSTFFALPGESDYDGATLRRRLQLWGTSRLDSPPLVDEIRHLDSGGWEIGLHSSLRARSEAPVLELEKRKLERLLGHPIQGVRQHFLAQDYSALWEVQLSSRFEYDSSMGFARGVGFRAGTCFPYELLGGRGWELPFEIMDGGLSDENEVAHHQCEAISNRVADVCGALVLLWHQRYFTGPEFAGYGELYETVIDEATAEGAWVAPCEEIVRQFRESVQ